MTTLSGDSGRLDDVPYSGWQIAGAALLTLVVPGMSIAAGTVVDLPCHQLGT
ncbi:MAG TPA: hypothetical protein VFV41_25800 [Streptosporangiaceae bacterium]|nr:hypothetical protein [Streptosporangiaceae bacterium]